MDADGRMTDETPRKYVCMYVYVCVIIIYANM